MLTWTPVTLSSFLKSIQEAHDRDGRIQLKIDADSVVDDLLIPIRQVSRIVGNLLENALKYSHGPVILRASIAGRHLEIDVEDDGEGLLEGEWDSLRQPFKRLPRHQHIDGHGLGLAIGAQIASSLEGSLELVPGQVLKGACVRLCLPL